MFVVVGAVASESPRPTTAATTMKSEPLANKSDTDRTIEAGQKRVEAGQKEEMGQRAGPDKKDGPKHYFAESDSRDA